MTLVTTDVPAQHKPTTRYAPVSGINMYYEVHGGGEVKVTRAPMFLLLLRAAYLKQ